MRARAIHPLALLACLLPWAASADALVEADAICPLDGEPFRTEAYASYYHAGTRLDGRPVLEGSPEILPPPVCPRSGFVVYRDNFTPAELERLRALVDSPGFRAARRSTVLHFPVAAYTAQQMGEPPLIVATLYLRGTWESEDRAPAEYEDLAVRAIRWLDTLLEERMQAVEPAEITLIAANLERQIGRFEATLARLAGMGPDVSADPSLAASAKLTRSLAQARDRGRIHLMPGS